MRVLAVLALMMATFAGSADARQVMARAECQTLFEGKRYAGIYVKEYWSYHHTFRHYGRFVDANRTVVEFEVFSGSDHGRGGLWFNGRKHREVHIDFQAFRGGFRLRADTGQVATYRCR